MSADFWLDVTVNVAQELLLFACMGMLLFGLDDIIFDLLWISKSVDGRWRARPLKDDPEIQQKRFAIFIPLWREYAVIHQMVDYLQHIWRNQSYDIFLGCYPNDDKTLTAAKALSGKYANVHFIVNDHAGPTTKADNLNNLWRGINSQEAWRDAFYGIILHDAEDKVHGDELRLYASLLPDHDMIQIPVLPLADPRSKWIAGHYMDEFAEAHGKELPLRHALGTPIPSAGVGTALSVPLLRKLAEQRGAPFDADSVTEDYELGWRAGLRGERTIFVRARGHDGSLIATQAYFPDNLAAAIRQKTRWVLGIALQGWDRLSSEEDIWQRPGSGKWQKICAHWMLWRDRRSILSAVLLLAGYWGGILYAALWLFHEAHPVDSKSILIFTDAWKTLFAVTTGFVLWRLMMRFYCVWRAYGMGEAILSIPRVFISNSVAIVASHRALIQYILWTRGAPQHWDKTDHRFPDVQEQRGR